MEKFLKLNYLDGIGEKVQWISLGTGSTKIFQVSGPWWKFWWDDQELRILDNCFGDIFRVHYTMGNRSTFTNHSLNSTGDIVKTNKIQ